LESVDTAESPALSEIGVSDTIATRKIAVLAADGVDVVGTQRDPRSPTVSESSV
jgi:catalase